MLTILYICPPPTMLDIPPDRVLSVRTYTLPYIFMEVYIKVTQLADGSMSYSQKPPHVCEWTRVHGVDEGAGSVESRSDLG